MRCGWAVRTLVAVAVVAGLAASQEEEAEEGGRFAKLDRLLSRLGAATTTENPEAGPLLATTAPPGAPTPAPAPAPAHLHHRRHWASWLRKNNKHGSHDEEEDDNDEDEDYEDNEDEEELQQADIAPRKPYSSTRSQWKWNSQSRHGDKMKTSYRSGPLNKPTESEHSAQREAYRHNQEMSEEAACHLPQLKVVRVSEHYPSSNKVYLPSCTKLHQCGEDTGCCPKLSQRCVPKTTERVERYFYSAYVVSQMRPQRTPTIEKLTFYNHTECECKDRTDDMPRDIDPREPQRFPDHQNNRCKCPSEYTVRYLANGSCSCDCFDKQRDCTKYKKGKEYFNHQDRLCIEMGSCTVPSCDFGAYLRRSGRCPRKHEKFRSWPRYN